MSLEIKRDKHLDPSPDVQRARDAIRDGAAQSLDEREIDLIAGLIVQTDQEYLRWLSAYLQRASGCDYA